MQTKAFVFSFDALLALALAILLCAAVVSILTYSSDSSISCIEEVNDSSIMGLYLNNTTSSSLPSPNNGFCSRYCRYAATGIECYDFCEVCG